VVNEYIHHRIGAGLVVDAEREFARHALSGSSQELDNKPSNSAGEHNRIPIRSELSFDNYTIIYY
jgi:hypothetical protein